MAKKAADPFYKSTVWESAILGTVVFAIALLALNLTLSLFQLASFWAGPGAVCLGMLAGSAAEIRRRRKK